MTSAIRVVVLGVVLACLVSGTGAQFAAQAMTQQPMLNVQQQQQQQQPVLFGGAVGGLAGDQRYGASQQLQQPGVQPKAIVLPGQAMAGIPVPTAPVSAAAATTAGQPAGLEVTYPLFLASAIKKVSLPNDAYTWTPEMIKVRHACVNRPGRCSGSKRRPVSITIEHVRCENYKLHW